MQSINLIKKQYEQFSIKNHFKYQNSTSLVAPADSKLLFNISGGVRYQNELLGLKKTDLEKVSSIQECVRTDSLDKIGYSQRHHLFFEMLGHFMFYLCNEKECKGEFINFAFKFLTKEIGLDKNRIFVTVHSQDNVTIDVWKKIGNTNLILSDNNTFVSPYADKSALRTEIKWLKNDNSLVELWNLVFTQFDSKELFKNPMNFIAADSGASLERIVSAYENKDNNYENSMWKDYIDYLTTLSSKGTIEDYRRLADFFNTSVKLFNEGIIPGNKVQAYVLRKLLRTIFDLCNKLDINYIDLIDNYFKFAGILSVTNNEVLKLLKEELEKYQLTINNGIIQAQKLIRKKGIENVSVNYLKSTCGLPDYIINDILNNEQMILVKK